MLLQPSIRTTTPEPLGGQQDKARGLLRFSPRQPRREPITSKSSFSSFTSLFAIAQLGSRRPLSNGQENNFSYMPSITKLPLLQSEPPARPSEVGE